jgi:hypothetical protein
MNVPYSFDLNLSVTYTSVSPSSGKLTIKYDVVSHLRSFACNRSGIIALLLDFVQLNFQVHCYSKVNSG